MASLPRWPPRARPSLTTALPPLHLRRPGRSYCGGHHATRAQLLLLGGRNRASQPGCGGDPRGQARGRREIDEALRLDPGNVRARAIAHFELGQLVDLDAAERAIEVSPGDWMAWLLLAEAFHQRHMHAEGDTAERAVELAWDDRSVTITLIRTVDGAKKP
jgi:hypothetical protein